MIFYKYIVNWLFKFERVFFSSYIQIIMLKTRDDFYICANSAWIG